MAHDIAAEKHYKATPKLSRDAFNQPRYHCPIPLLDFLRALLHEDYHAQVLQAMPICQSDTKKSKSITLETAFAEAYVSFSHFSLAADSVMLSNPCLATALARGMAIQAVDGQRSIDAVIPVHIGSLNAQVSTKRTSAINIQVKNRKDVRDCPVDRSITIPDVSKPVISIIFELGCSRPGVRVNHRPHASDGDPRVDYHHYEIVIYGHSSTVLGVIPPGEEPTYRSILGAARAQDDLPRRNDGLGSIEAFYALKPAFSGRRQLERYAGLIDGVEAPMEEPKEKTSKASKGEGSKGKGQPEASKAPEDKEPRPKRQTRASGASKEEDQTGKRQTRASGAPKEEEPTKKRQTRASGAPKEEQTGKRQAKASGAPKEEEPAKKRQPRAQKSQPSPPKKKQKK
ncbi:hypothetical protein FRC10_006128 [Ceratobasidium sp. 414]|nr:hypothetical protein FRC10_006128 [Ceratobasidium sp. 414]